MLAAWINRDIVGASDCPRSYTQVVPASCGLHGAGIKDVWLYASGQAAVEPIHVRFREREGMRERESGGERERERARGRGGEVTSWYPSRTKVVLIKLRRTIFTSIVRACLPDMVQVQRG
jgi:hypothetical protein